MLKKNVDKLKFATNSQAAKWKSRSTFLQFSLGVDQLPVAMTGPQGLFCFITRTTPGGSKKVGWPLILPLPTFWNQRPRSIISYLYTCSLRKK